MGVMNNYEPATNNNRNTLNHLLDFAALMLKNENLKKISDQFQFYFQNVSYSDIFQKITNPKDNKNETLFSLDEFGNWTVGIQKEMDSQYKISPHKDNEEDNKKIDTDEIIKEYVKIMDKINNIKPDDNTKDDKKDTSDSSVLESTTSPNRFFYSGVDWTLNLLPTLLIMKIAFIAGKKGFF